MPLIFVALVMQGEYKCTVPITNWSYEQLSPNGRARAEVRNLGLKPHRLEMRISIQRKTRTVLRHDYGELYVGFCELHWTPDSRIVELFVTNPIDGTHSVFAYDIVGDHAVDVGWATEDLKQVIARKYLLPAGTDPFKWARTSEAQEAFILGRK